jgi:hypothetical protein
MNTFRKLIKEGHLLREMKKSPFDLVRTPDGYDLGGVIFRTIESAFNFTQLEEGKSYLGIREEKLRASPEEMIQSGAINQQQIKAIGFIGKNNLAIQSSRSPRGITTEGREMER